MFQKAIVYNKAYFKDVIIYLRVMISDLLNKHGDNLIQQHPLKDSTITFITAPVTLMAPVYTNKIRLICSSLSCPQQELC